MELLVKDAHCAKEPVLSSCGSLCCFEKCYKVHTLISKISSIPIDLISSMPHLSLKLFENFKTLVSNYFSHYSLLFFVLFFSFKDKNMLISTFQKEDAVGRKEGFKNEFIWKIGRKWHKPFFFRCFFKDSQHLLIKMVLLFNVWDKWHLKEYSTSTV